MTAFKVPYSVYLHARDATTRSSNVQSGALSGMTVLARCLPAVPFLEHPDLPYPIHPKYGERYGDSLIYQASREQESEGR